MYIYTGIGLYIVLSRYFKDMICCMAIIYSIVLNCISVYNTITKMNSVDTIIVLQWWRQPYIVASFSSIVPTVEST